MSGFSFVSKSNCIPVQEEYAAYGVTISRFDWDFFPASNIPSNLPGSLHIILENSPGQRAPTFASIHLAHMQERAELELQTKVEKDTHTSTCSCLFWFLHVANDTISQL